MDAAPKAPCGVLYIVATPIGNLEDATRRSIRILGEVDLIAAEDTRRTKTLLRHYGIRTPTRSHHAHNERQASSHLIAALKAGRSVALVTDAGMPLLSDPGRMLVDKALDRNVRVSVIPGPSAVLTALVASGLASTAFTFLGFPPSRSGQRKRWLQSVAREARPLVLFEAPHRIHESLRDVLEILGDRPVAVGRELTKVHEEWIRGRIPEVLDHDRLAQGELTVVIGPAATDGSGDPGRPADLAVEYGQMTEAGRSRREAIRLLAARHGVSQRVIYALLEDSKAR